MRGLRLPITCIVIGIAVLYLGERSVAAIFHDGPDRESPFTALERLASTTIQRLWAGSVSAEVAQPARVAPITPKHAVAESSVDTPSSASKVSVQNQRELTLNKTSSAPAGTGSWFSASTHVLGANQIVASPASNLGMAAGRTSRIGPAPNGAPAATYNWDGDDPSSNLWSKNKNWFGDTLPGVGSSVDISFNFQNQQQDSSYDYGDYDDFHSIIFQSSLPKYLHLNNPSGRGMDLFGSIVNNSNQGVDFNVDVAFRINNSNIEANNSQLVFNNGNIYLNGLTIHFLSANAKDIYVNGALHDGGATSGSQIVLDSSFMNVHLSNSGNNYTGQTTINFGTLVSESDNVIPDVSELFIGGSGVWNKNGKTENVASIFGSGSILLGSTGNLGYLSNASRTFSGKFTGSAPVVKGGTGTWTLTGNSTSMTGDFYVVGGTLELGNDNAAGLSGTIYLGETTGAAPATLLLDSGVNVNRTVEVRSGSSGGKTIQGNAGSSATSTLSGVVVLDAGTGAGVTLQNTGAGTLALTSQILGSAGVTIGNGNAGTVLLSGANSYNGGTTVSAGTLIVNNTSGGSATGSGAVMVNNSGTTLGGIGSISGATTINAGARITGGTAGSGGTIVAGNIGILTLTGNLTFIGNSGSPAIYLVDIGSGTNNSDRLAIGGTLSLTTTFDQIIFNGTPDGTSSYVLATYSSLNGVFDLGSAPGGYQFIYGSTELDLVPVPEPATWLAGGLTLGALLVSQRRRLMGLIG